MGMTTSELDRAWAEVQVLLSAGLEDLGANALERVTDFERTELVVSFAGWEGHQHERMPDGWLYLVPDDEPTTGWVLASPTTAELAFEGSGMLALFESFTADSPRVIRLDHDRAMDALVTDLLTAEPLAGLEDA